MAGANLFDDLNPDMTDAAPPPQALPAPVAAAPPQANIFDDLNPDTQPENDTSGFGAFAHSAERSVLPALGGLAVMGAGAEAGAAAGGGIGALVGAPFGGVGAVPGAGVGAVVGGLVGGVGAMMGGSWAAQQVQDYGLKALPESWQDALGQSDRQQQLDQQYHPTESFLGGLLPYALTMRPGGFGGAAPAANATALQRILANPMTARVFGGAMMGGMELGQEAASGQQPNWTNIAISTGFGMVFNKPTRLGESLTELSAAPTRQLLGRPSPTGAPAANLNTAAGAEPAGAPEAAAAPAAERSPGVTERDWNETILGQQPPTVAQAADAKVMGPGITEDVFMGAHQQAPEAAMAAQDTARTEASLYGPQQPTPQDLHAVARQLQPELFDHYDALSAQRDDLRAHLANLASPSDEQVAQAQAQVTQMQGQFDAHVASRNGYAGGPEARAMRAQLRDAQAQVDALNARRDAFAAGQGADTPEMTALRQQIMATDLQMRDLAPEIAAAHRRAADRLGSGLIEPAAPTVEEPPQPVVVPAEAVQPAEAVAPLLRNPDENLAASLPGAAEAPAAPTPQQQATQIADHVTEQLIAAGRPLDEARAGGQLIASHYRARAARFGGARGSALDLYHAEAPVIRGYGPNVRAVPTQRAAPAPAVEPKAPAVPAIEPQAARATAEASGDSKLIEQLVGRGASDREIATVVSRRLSPEQIAAFRETIAEPKPPLMPTEAQPEIGNPPEVIEARAAEAQPEPEPVAAASAPEPAAREPVTVDQAVAPPAQGSGIESFDPNEIGVDAKRFQFKAGGDEAGVSERLQDIKKWNALLAGTALVFRDPDGKLWIADGHQRLGLAKRLIAQGQTGIRLNAFVLDAADGVSDAQARSIAAIKNIAEGTGTAVDAAKVLREAKESGMDLPPLPPRSSLVRDGNALAELSPDAFGIIVNEVVPPAQGAIVGRLVKDPAEQVEALRLLAKVKPENATQAEMIVRDMLGSGTEQMTRQDSLFGEEAFAGSVVLERAKIADEALKQLRKDKATFGTLVKETERIEGLGSNTLDQAANESRLTADEKASDLLTQLAFRAGPVSDELSAIARRLKSGDLNAAGAARDFLGIVRRAIESGVDTGADAGVAEPSAAGESQGLEPAELAEEPGAEGLPQTLIPGVLPISERERLDHDAARPLQGGEAAPGGLFDEDGQNQQTLFQAGEPDFSWLGRFSYDGAELRDGDTVVGKMKLRQELDAETPHVVIDDIEIGSGKKGEGRGTEVIRAIMDEANKRGLAVALTSDAMRGKAQQTRLRAYYTRLGFDRNRGATKLPGVKAEFVRPPRVSDASGDPSAAQALMYGAGLDTPEKLADFGKRVSSLSETDGLLSGESDVAVMDQMRGAAVEQGQVLDSVVGSVPVDVVNNLFGSERAAKVALHDEAVLKDGSAFDTQLPVSNLSDRGRAVRLLVGEVARDAAERPSVPAVSVPGALEGGPAVGADEGGNFNQGKRASITFRAGQKPILKLFAEANASSFLHETGHQWLEELLRDAVHPAANDSLKADGQTVRAWLGMTDEQAAPVTRQHEKFARGFEQYMREGVAPSAGLAKVFSQFKTWLTSIYQSLKGLGTPISDDIRGVFDRLVAEEPNRTVVAPEREAPSSLAALHEQDVAAAHPAEAEPISDRIAAERDRAIADQHPEVQNELAAAESQLAAADAADAGAEDRAGAAGSGQVVADRGQPEPQPAGGSGGGERGPLNGGGAAGVEQGAGVAAGGGTAGGGADADAGLRQQRSESAGAARAQPLAPEPAHSFGDAESPFLDKAGNIRVENLSTSADVAQAIHDAADANNDFIGDRRGVITDGQVLDLADALGMDANTLSQRKLGQAFNAEQVVAARKLLIQSASDVGGLMRKAATGSDADVLAYAQAKARHQLIQGQVAGITAEAGRALRAFRDISGDAQAQGIDQFLRNATGKTLFQLKEEAKLGAQLDTPEKVSKFIADSRKRGFWDMVLEYWINGLISGVSTHTTYMVGNTILTAVKAGPETAAAAAIGAARAALGRDGERVRLGEVGAQVGGAVKALPMATMAALDSLRTGVTARLPGEPGRTLPFQPKGDLAPAPDLRENIGYGNFVPELFGTVRGLRDGIIANGALLKAGGVANAPAVGWRTSPLGAIPDLAVRGVPVLPVGSAARLPSRFVAAIHSFFRAINYSMAKNALAYRAAAEFRDPVTQQALAGTAFDAKVADLRQNPTTEMMQQARQTSTQLTLMGQGSDFVQALGKLTNVRILGVPMLKFVDPFVHIAGNIIDQSLVQRTPVGLLSPELRADLMGKNGNVAQDTAMGRMLVGTGLAITFGTLAAQGLMSGSEPADRNQAAMWRLAGNQAHSIRIGDMWYQVNRLGPMGMLAGIAADMYDVSHAASQGDLLQAGSELQHAFTQNILDESFMSGPAELIQALEDPGRYGQAYIRNFLSSFVPYSVAMGQMAKATDPYARQARSVVDAIRAKVPGLSQTLTARRDIWGQPIANPDAIGGRGLTAIYMQQVGQDPVNQALYALGVYPAMPQPDIRGVRLDPQQYDYYSALAGSMAKQRLNVIIGSPDFANWSPTTRHDVISEVINQSRETARGMTMMKYPGIVAQATQAKLAKLR